jgi:thymidylate synthase (FAD)
MIINVLNQGYVKFVESWGTGFAGCGETMIMEGSLETYESVERDFEVGIIEAARQSTQGAFRGWDKGDDKLLSSLFNNRPQHATPFEFAGCIIEVQAPIFVFREWHRHRVQSYNEMSARYAKLPDLYYEPSLDMTVKRSEDARTAKNKQLQGTVDAPIIPADVGNWLHRGFELQQQLEEFYKDGLKIGVPKELARYNMPVSHYTRMRASTNLRNWLAFETLRDEKGVQWETREYADALRLMLEAVFPRTMQLFKQRRRLENELYDRYQAERRNQS